MNRAVVGISARLGKGERELFVRIQHLGLEHSLRADRRVGNVITVRPGHGRADGHRERRWPKHEIIDFHRRAAGWLFALTLGDPTNSSSVAITTGIAKPATHAFFFVIVPVSFSNIWFSSLI